MQPIQKLNWLQSPGPATPCTSWLKREGSGASNPNTLSQCKRPQGKDPQTETPATQHPMIPHSLPPQKRKTASACWRELQQAWESQGSRKLKKQSKGRSRSLDSCGERREQRKLLWPPPQPHGIKADAPAKLSHTVEEGGAHRLKLGWVLQKEKTPWNHTPCAAQEETTEQHLGRAETTVWERWGVPWTPQPSKTRRIHHPLPQTHARIYKHHHTEDNIVLDIVSKGPTSPACEDEALTERKIDCTWPPCTAGTGCSDAANTELPPPKDSCSYPCCAATAGAHEQPQEKEPYLSYHLTLRPAGQRYQRPAGRRKEEVANQPAPAPVLRPQTHSLYRGYARRGLSGSGVDPSRPVQAKSLQEWDYYLAEYPD